MEVGKLEERRVLSHTAPTLTGANALTAITQGQTNNGTLVSTLINGKTNTGQGIAITATNNGGGGSNGTWWYKVPAGNWTQFPGSLSDTNAFLLDRGDSVRFVPNVGFTGSASITFRAWDESTGSDTGMADVSTNGGSTAYSGTTETATVAVSPPSAPSFSDDGGGGPSVSILDDQTAKPYNNAVDEISLVESDSTDLLSLTVTLKSGGVASDVTGSLSGGNFAKTGVGTYTVSGVDATDATTDLQALVFSPSRGTAGTKVDSTFAVSATDLYSQSAGPLSVDVDVTGNTTPTLSGTFDFAAIPQGSTSSTVDGTQVSTLISGKVNNTNDGVAIVNVDNSNGQWEWSPDNTVGSWVDLTGETASSAFLLSKTDYLRFIPNSAPSFEGTAGISFVAWDGTSGTLDTTALPGSGAFSSPSVTASIDVTPVISIGGTGTSYGLTNQTPAPFALATISDSDSSDTVTITITQQFSGGSTDLLFANGALSSPNAAFTSASDGVYTLANIPFASAEADLQAMTFFPAAGTAGTSRTTKFGIVVSDSFLSENSASDDGTALVIASPPLLTGVTDFTSIPAESTSAAMLVSNLITANPSSSGAAVVAADDSNGVWQYNHGSGWVAIPTSPVALSTSSAFLLSSTDEVRFVSNTGIGNTSTLTLLAWNGADGTEGHRFDTTAVATAGDFSTNEKVATITMLPVLSISGTGEVDTSLGQTITPFENVAVADSDNTETVTITITQIAGGSTDTGLADGTLASSGATLTELDGVYTLSNIPEADAQADLQALTFTPAAGTAGASLTTSFQIQLSDRFDPANTVATSAAIAPKNEVLVVKSPPILNGANNLAPEDSAHVTGTEVSALIYSPDQVVDPSDTALGIAVTGVTGNSVADGQWQWATTNSPNNSNWHDLSGGGATSAFLLANTDFVRFVPAAGFSGTATITFLAWDGTSGTLHNNADTTTAANLGAFSAASATASTHVSPVLTITGTGTTAIHDDQQATPFFNGPIGTIDATIGDSVATDTVTVTIVQQFENGPNAGMTDSALMNGTLSGTGLTINTGVDAGTYTLSGTAAAVTTELQALVFTPQPAAAGPPVGTTFQISVADGSATVKTDSGTVVQVTHVPPPGLTGSSNLPPVPENATSTTGILVSDLPLGGGAGLGIAVSAFDDTNGTWEYLDPNSATPTMWIDIPAVAGLTPPMGTPPGVFLLASTDSIRFIPNTGFVTSAGMPTITFQAWNQDSGLTDTIANPSLPLLQAGLSPSTATASVEVFPTLTLSASHSTTSLDDQTSTPFSGATITDSDSSDPSEMVTITITQMTSTGIDATLADGSLSSSGATLTQVGGVYTMTVAASDATAALQALVFAPTLHEAAAGQTVVTKFSVQVSDGAFGPVNTIASPSPWVLTVTANAIPQLTGSNPLPSIPENISGTNDGGALVSDLLQNQASDSDNDVLGIAVTQVQTTSGGATIGEWDYSTDGGASWTAITGVSGTSALLLAPTDRVRFLPAANFFGTATIQYQAWDQSIGSPTQTIDPTALPSAGAFSTPATAATASIQVVAPASIFASARTVTTNDETAVMVFATAFGPQIAGSPAPGITDPNSPAVNYTVTVVIGTPANGTFSNFAAAGWTSPSSGTFQFTGTAAAANLALQALSFQPKAHQVQPGLSETTGFTITVNDGVTAPTSLGTITVIATAVVDPPTFVSLASTSASLPVSAANGAAVVTARATDVDASPDILYSITGGNSSGAYAIDGNGNITVANNAALAFSMTPTVLTITAVNFGASGVASTPTVGTRTIYLWAVTASATPIATDSSTTLTLSLLYPTSPSPPLLSVGPLTVSWSDGATNSATLTSTKPTVTLVHFYTTNPNKADPAAPIPINVVGTNVSAQTTALVSGTGVGIAVIPDTQSSFVALVAPPALEAAPALAVVDQPVTETVDAGVAESQTTTGTDRSVVLRIVSPAGKDGEPIPVWDGALNDLPSLFKKLPDGHYRVYLTEGGHERLMIDVMVRQGRPVNSSDDSGDTDDRPPTSQINSDKTDGPTDADPSAPKGQVDAGQEKQFSNGSGQPATEGNHQNTPPSSPSPGATQTPPASSPAAANGTPTAAILPINRSEKWAAWIAGSAGIAAAAAVGIDPQHTDEFMEKLSKRSLSKSARLSRRLRK